MPHKIAQDLAHAGFNKDSNTSIQLKVFWALFKIVSKVLPRVDLTLSFNGLTIFQAVRIQIGLRWLSRSNWILFHQMHINVSRNFNLLFGLTNGHCLTFFLEERLISTSYKCPRLSLLTSFVDIGTFLIGSRNLVFLTCTFVNKNKLFSGVIREFCRF